MTEDSLDKTRGRASALLHETATPLLEMRAVTKRFGGVAALRNVDFSITEGEIHGLVGENGAGKSTMMKIIAGVHADFEGEMFVGGKPVTDVITQFL